jgi:hypothetical protein
MSRLYIGDVFPAERGVSAGNRAHIVHELLWHHSLGRDTRKGNAEHGYPVYAPEMAAPYEKTFRP